MKCVLAGMPTTVKRPFNCTPDHSSARRYSDYVWEQREWLNSKLDVVWNSGSMARSPEAGLVWWIVEKSFWDTLAERQKTGYKVDEKEAREFMNNKGSVLQMYLELLQIPPKHAIHYLNTVIKIIEKQKVDKADL